MKGALRIDEAGVPCLVQRWWNHGVEDGKLMLAFEDFLGRHYVIDALQVVESIIEMGSDVKLDKISIKQGSLHIGTVTVDSNSTLPALERLQPLWWEPSFAVGEATFHIH